MAAPLPAGRPASAPKNPPKPLPIPSEWKIELPKQGAIDDRLFGGCRSIEVGYEKKAMVGEGTYGEVFKAVDKATGDIVAMKKIRMDNEKEGFPITAIREIKILSSLANAQDKLEGRFMRNNIITLREIVRSASHKSNNEKGSIYMVFDYMEHDMTGLLQRMNMTGRHYNEAQLKCILKQLFCGLALLQNKKILHRDLKNSNLLLNNKGELKIADFGLARYLSKAGQQQSTDGRGEGRMTNRVITVWYRPPELFLGSEHYGPEIDMWSAGCIMFELLTGKPLFPGKNEPETLEEIFRLMGKPNEDNMPGCSKLQYYNTINVNNPKYPNRSQLRTFLGTKNLDKTAIDLLEKLLVLDPKGRIDATQAAMHPWFYKHPVPCQPHELPKFEESHEMNMKKRRHEQQAAQQGRQQRQRTDGQYGGTQQGYSQQAPPPAQAHQQQQQQYAHHGGGPHRGMPPLQQPHMAGPMGPGRSAPAAPGGNAPRFAPIMPPIHGTQPRPMLVPPIPGAAYQQQGAQGYGGGMPLPQQQYPGHQQPTHGRQQQYGGSGGAPPQGYRGGQPPPQQQQQQQPPPQYAMRPPGSQPEWAHHRR